MHPNAAVIERFYSALGRRDAEAMLACYAPDVTFSDPVFPALDAAGVAAMWRMLCARGKDLEVSASCIEADATAGRAHWDATYTYSGTGRRVVNAIDATFAFRDGRICRHQDRFGLYRWLRQALGWKGVRAQAAGALAQFRAQSAAR